MDRKCLEKLWQTANHLSPDSQGQEECPSLTAMCSVVDNLIRTDSLSLKNSSMMVAAAVQLYSNQLGYLVTDFVQLDKKIWTRNFRTQSSDVSDFDTDAEIHEEVEATKYAKKSDDNVSESSNLSFERPEQMQRDTQRELSISPIWKTKGTKRNHTWESDEEETPVKKPCDRRMSVSPKFSPDKQINNTETGADAEDIIWKRLTSEVYSDPSTPSAMFGDDELDSDSDVESISGRAVYPASQDYWAQASDDALDNEGDTSEISTQDDNIRRSLYTISEANEDTTALSLSQPQSPTPTFDLELPLFASPGATRPGVGATFTLCSDDDAQEKSQCDLRIPSHSAPEIDTPKSNDDAIVATSSGYPSKQTVIERPVPNSSSLATTHQVIADEEEIPLSPTYSEYLQRRPIQESNLSDQQLGLQATSAKRKRDLILSPILNKVRKKKSKDVKKRRVDDVDTQVEVHRPSVSEDIQTAPSSRHVSIQTDPPADPGSTLPYATTLVFGTSRAVPCLVLVSSADPSILNMK